MCIFTGKVDVVNNTNIFCRGDNGMHILVYQMSAEINEDMAMILPVPAGEQDDAIEFINLEKYEDFFSDMDELFDDPYAKSLGDFVGVASSRSMLKVHDVGNFVASYVPRMKDLERLDEQFRLPEDCFVNLPDYDNFGFAVFKLKPGRWRSKRQAMAYKFKSTHPEFLFYPTVHIHDGEVPMKADYDHVLYFQPGDNFKTLEWDRAYFPPKAQMEIDLCQGLVDPDIHIERFRVRGNHVNHDHMINLEGEVIYNSCRDVKHV